jgi:nucleotide-binding universal stress UspA family protein
VLGLTHSVLEQAQARQRERQEEAQTYLEHLAQRVASKGCRLQTRVVIEERPDTGILQEEQVGDADLIAMETHGRHGLSRLLLGSVADQIVRGGIVPVLLHRPGR